MATKLSEGELNQLAQNNIYDCGPTMDSGEDKTYLPIMLNPAFVDNLKTTIERMPPTYSKEIREDISWQLSVPEEVYKKFQDKNTLRGIPAVLGDGSRIRGFESIEEVFLNILFKDKQEIGEFIVNLFIICAAYQRNPERIDNYVVTNWFNDNLMAACYDSPYQLISYKKRSGDGLSEMSIINRRAEPTPLIFTNTQEYKKYWIGFYEMIVKGIPLPIKYLYLSGYTDKIRLNIGKRGLYSGKLLAIYKTGDNEWIRRRNQEVIFSRKELPIRRNYDMYEYINTKRILTFLPPYAWIPAQKIFNIPLMNWDFIPF